MAVPKRKTSKSRRNMRRSHDGINNVQTVECPACKAPRIPHRVCPSCGYYNGRKVMDVEEA
ncbi:MAG: 50S ribosomal protein L32 [Candidatus Aureabacteria bacterium]|nr:50S ribosomal protein L32 [Candidatus Auribacterota bacterium]